MSILLRIIKKINPQDKTKFKFHLVQKKAGSQDMDAMAVKIARREDITEGNVMAVIKGLLHEMGSMLALNQTVRLGKFGSFHLSVQSEGADTPEELTTRNVKHVKIVFVPGTELKDELAHLSFTIETAIDPSGDHPEADDEDENHEIPIAHEEQ
jgi:predicted histone-like DNA-binding protein